MPNRPITKKEREAWKFAKEAHKGQVRKFIGLPYFDVHVKKVNEIVKRYTTDEDLLCAAILHDVPEDCYDDYEVGLAEIENLFGSRVSKLVSELTSSKDEIDEVYDGDKASYLADKMIHMSDDALIIKLSDRLQNISDAFTAAERFRNKYFEETWRIVEDIEKHRQFNKIQTILLNEIKAKLSNIGSIFKIKRFNEFNESLSHIPYVLKTVEEMLYEITDFDFETKVNLEGQKYLVIEIKKDSKEHKVFDSVDIKETLIEINEYLTLGEGLKLRDIHVNRILRDSFSTNFMFSNFEEFNKKNIRMLECILTYNI